MYGGIGQTVPKAPSLPALYDSDFVISVEVDKAESTCTDIDGLKQNCHQISGSIPSPHWVGNIDADADDSVNTTTDATNTTDDANDANDTRSYCENVVSKVCIRTTEICM